MKNTFIMGKEAYIIISFDDFLKAANFNKSELKDQIAYLLFYVTIIAKLRKDMTPHVISERLNDQIRILNAKYSKGESYCNLKLTTPDFVEKEMIKRTEYFNSTHHDDNTADRKGSQQPYILTKEREEKLKKDFNYYWKEKVIEQRCYDKSFNLILIVVFLAIGISIVFFQVNNSNKLGISWQEYKKKAEWEQLDNYNKSIHILHYITNVTEFNDDMTPEVLSDRLVSLKYDLTPSDSIRIFLLNSDLVIKSYMRDDAFMISPKGEKIISEKVGIISPYKYDGNVDFIWIWKNQPDIYVGIILLIAAPFTVGIRIAYNRGKKVCFVNKEEK